ncbi:MAG: glycosyltransferase [Clostridia bacterium]|nr:glycosyltransferase [Clostridia bacterium]MBQ5834373.1 glycosyltransferase [Clostridia bacterium]
MKISICIPMYNENRVIADTAKTLSAYMEAHYQDYELLFCSDGSTDGCDQTVRSLNLPNVRVIGYEQNRGKGCAVRTAMLAATGDVRMFLDADLAYGIDVIDRVFQFFAAGREEQVVVGSRNLQKDGYAGYTFLRKIASKTYIRVLGFVGGFRLSDSQCGCKAFSATAAQEIFSRCEIDGFAFDIETILWATKLEIKIAEIPVRVIRHSDSKVRLLRDTFRMLRDLTKAKKRIQKK